MGSAIKTKNIIFIMIVLVIIVVVSYGMAYVLRQNREYARLNQVPIVKEESVEPLEEEINAGTDLPMSEEYGVGRGDIEFRSGDDIIIF